MELLLAHKHTLKHLTVQFSKIFAFTLFINFFSSFGQIPQLLVGKREVANFSQKMGSAHLFFYSQKVFYEKNVVLASKSLWSSQI